VENFRNWELIYTAKLVSTSNINVALLHEVIAQALRDNAGSIGYLITDDATNLIKIDWF